MAKFDELSKLKVWNETVTKETRAWSDGLKANPPSKDFRVVQPHKSESLAAAAATAAAAAGSRLRAAAYLRSVLR